MVQMKIQIKNYLFFAFVFVFAVNTLGQGKSVSTSDTVALVNSQPVTLGDLDPEIQKAALELEEKIAAVRRQMLEDQINNYLYEAESMLRKQTKQQYLSVNVGAKVRPPTAKEIEDIYDLNRAAFANTDIETAKKQIVTYLKNQKAQQLLNDLAVRLRKTHKVVMGVEVNKPNLAPVEVLATVDGRAITASAMEEKLKPLIYDFRMEIYEAQVENLNKIIYNRLILDEARKRNIGPEEIIRVEINDKFHYPTEDDIRKFYDTNKIVVPYAQARSEIMRYLEAQEQERLESELDKKLRSVFEVKILLAEPKAPIQNISTANAPGKGSVNAPVTVVMFTDFQCPACSRTHPILTDILKKYGDKIRFVVRDFPLDDLHPQARKSAEAAAAANAQGKFFEYIELLYKNQNALDVVSLKKYASQTGLDRVKFDADLTSGKFAAEIQKDYEDGILYGIKSTPTIFVNGVKVRSLEPTAIQNAIERAFAEKQ